MESQKFIWMNGRLAPWKEANVHFLTHTLHYGTGVFEGIRFYKTPKGPAIFRLPEHVDRLYESAKVFAMEIPFSKEEMTRAIIKTVIANGLEEGYIRPLVYLGGKMGLNPVGAPVNCGIAVWPWGAYLSKPVVDTIISKYIRVHSKSGEMAAKISGVYFNSALASLEAYRAGVDEAILLDAEGYVAEGPGENIFIVKQGEIITPPLGTILPGITRATVIELISDLSHGLMKVQERKFRRGDLFDANEAFFTGTAVEITAIGKVNGLVIGNGKIGETTSFIKNLYNAIVHGQKPEYERWLTYVK